MNCPACKDVVLSLAERHGVEIDFCPKCRGVWLDRGELDKIIERSEGPPATTQSGSQHTTPPQPQHPQPQPYQAPPPAHGYPRGLDDSDFDRPAYNPGYDPRYDPRYGKYKKRKSILREIFDF